MAQKLSLESDDLVPVKKKRGPDAEELVPLQFKMSPDFVKTFKQVALDHNLKLNELLKASFQEFMRKNGKN